MNSIELAIDIDRAIVILLSNPTLINLYLEQLCISHQHILLFTISIDIVDITALFIMIDIVDLDEFSYGYCVAKGSG